MNIIRHAKNIDHWGHTMNKAIIACLFSVAATNIVSASDLIDVGGGFAYSPLGERNCQVLFDPKYNKPILQKSTRNPPKAVLIGSSKDCPKEYDGYKVTRLAAGQPAGHIYVGVTDDGRRLNAYRRAGSDFTVRLAPKKNK